MKPTKEQEEILKAVKSEVGIIKINAFAGTGKTTTLNMIAKQNPSKKILYLAFNKSIAAEAKEKFPKNVTVKTVHALAYYNIVVLRGYKNVRGNYKSVEIAEEFDVDISVAKRALMLFENFCNSALDFELPSFFLNIEEDNEPAKIAYALYEKMRQKEMPITHSFYLKEFELSLKERPRLKYDMILLDEAQDTNDVTLSVFYLLKSPKKILVGDRHQQIYSFRGSINAMNKVKAKVFNLTASFRFNDAIAKKANSLLSVLKGEKNKLKGLGGNGDFESFAYISRTNASLIEKIATKEKDETFKTVRDPYSIFALALNVLDLLDGKPLDKGFEYLGYITDTAKRRGDMLKVLGEFAAESEDVELKSTLSLIDNYGKSIRNFYDLAVRFWEIEKPDFYLSTAHTSKGLEFSEVELCDDFYVLEKISDYFFESEIYPDGGDFIRRMRKEKLPQPVTDEINLFYVAVTRAKNRVTGGEILEKLNDEQLFYRYANREIKEIFDIKVKMSKTVLKN